MSDNFLLATFVSNIIDALYETLLLRKPDSRGRQNNIEHYTALLSKGGNYSDLIRGFLLSAEFSDKILSFTNTYGSSEHNKLTIDHSQYGEIDILVRPMINAAAKHRFVVDVGANGRQRSNSYDLLRLCQWKGILIEGNPSLIPKITRDFADLDVQIVNSAVSDYAGDGTLYIGINDDVSSLTEQVAANWGDTRGSVPVKFRLLSEILKSFNVPVDFDLLSIDIEGHDIQVFNEIIEEGYRPHWVIIEASFGFLTKSLDDCPFSDLVKTNYGICGQTLANLILCHGLKPENGRSG